MGKEYKFDAFISYRHTEPDQFAAQLLHKRLEAFKLPKNVVSKLGEDGRKKISRVFRDQEELPLASNLADTITVALEESDFLIVICTPRLPESRWCRKEISTFLENHDRSHVLAVLLEGEPDESFPDELRYVDEVVTDPDGTTRTVRTEIEPLAADFRGSTHKEIAKKMDLEILRLLAPMFGVDFDDLRQRHRERKMKRIIRISAAVSAVFFSFALVSTTMALRISRQNIEIQNKNTEIQKQNDEIQKQNDEIQEQNEKIEAQYKEVLKNESTILAARSAEELLSGDRIKAVETALSALPKDPENPERPIVGDAEYALTQALYAYDNGYAYRSQRKLSMPATVGALILSTDGDRILAADQAGNIRVWEGATGKRLCNINTGHGYFDSSEEVRFVDNDHVAVTSKRGFGLVEISTKKVLYENTDQSVYGLYGSLGGKFLGTESYRGVGIYDAMTGENLYQEDYTTDDNCMGIYFDPDERYVAITYNLNYNEKDLKKRTSKVEILDLSTMEVVRTVEKKYQQVNYVRFEGDAVYIGYTRMSLMDPSEVSELMRNFTNYNYNGQVEKISVKTGNVLWSKGTEDAPDKLITSRENNWDFVMMQSTSRVTFFDKEKGEVISAHEFDYNIADVAFNEDGSVCTIVTTDGERQLMRVYTNEVVNIMDSFIVPCEVVRNALFGNDFVAIRPSTANCIYMLGRSEGIGYKKRWDNEGSSLFSTQFSNDGKYMLASVSAVDSQMNLVDLTTGKSRFWMERASSLDTYTLVGDGSEYIAFFETSMRRTNEEGEEDPDYIPGTITLYSMEDGSAVKELKPSWVDSDYTSSRVLGITADREYFKISTYDSGEKALALINIRTNEKESLWHMPNGVTIMDLSEDGKMAVVISSDEATLDLYQVTGDEEKDAEPVNSVSLNGAYVDKIFFSGDNRYIGVVYQDKVTELYSAEDLSLKVTLDKLEYAAESMTLYKNGYCLRGFSGAYFLDDDLELKCFVAGFQTLTPDEQTAYVKNSYGDLYETPLYSLGELISYANELLLQNDEDLTADGEKK